MCAMKMWRSGVESIYQGSDRPSWNKEEYKQYKMK